MKRISPFFWIVFLLAFFALSVRAPAQNPTQNPVRNPVQNSSQDSSQNESAAPSPNALGTYWDVFVTDSVRDWNQLAECGTPEWTPIVLPAVQPVQLNNVQWFRTRFDAPKLTSENQRTFLCFDGIKFASEIRIDGKEAGNYIGGSEPFELDVTPWVRDGGTHELVVRVEGATALASEKPADFKVPAGQHPADLFHGTILAPVGSQGFSSAGIWEPVRLEVRDTLSVEDLFIQTSWRERKITVECTVKNLTNQEVSVPVQISVEDSEIVFDAPLLTVPASGTASFKVEKLWENPRVWSPRDPHLYFLNLKLGDFVERQERFGFREIWCDGDVFVLNGVPFHALGAASHPRKLLENGDACGPARVFFESLRKANINCIRLHANYWPKAWCEVADEVGMPLILETGFFCWVGSYALNDDVFWKNYARHVKALQKKHRNNPAFCFLSMENEILHCGGEWVRKGNDLPALLAAEGRKARAFDATRPISFDGDMDPEGAADVVNPHYPMDFGGIRAGHEDCDWPRCCWWMEDGKFMACFPAEYWKWDRKKPLYIGEFLHIQQFKTQDPYSLVLGDSAFDDSMDGAMARAKAKTWRMQIPAYRAAGVSGMCPWAITEFSTPTMESPENPKHSAVRDSYEPVTFVLEPISATLELGKETPMKFWLLNDTDCVRELVLTVQIADETQCVTRRLNPAQRVAVVMNFKIPESIAQNTSNPADLSRNLLECRMKLEYRTADSAEKAEWNPDWNLYGNLLPQGEDRFFLKEGVVERIFSLKWRQNASKIPSELHPEIGFIGNPETAKILGATHLRDLNDTQLSKVSVLMIGENALTPLFDVPEAEKFTVGAANQAQNRLAEFLADSSHGVLILHQDVYPSGIFPVQTANLTLSSARNNEWTFEPSIEKPFKVSADAAFRADDLFGGPEGLEYAGTFRHKNLTMTQIPYEKEILETQKDVFGLCSKFLSNLISSDRALSRNPAPRLCVYDPSGKIQKKLNTLNIPFETTEPGAQNDSRTVNPGDWTLINADAPEAIEPKEGEKFLLCGLTPENRAAWSKIVPENMTIVQDSCRVSVNSSSEAAPSENDGLYTGPNCYLIWYENRAGLTARQTMPEQSISDWYIVPFIPVPENENPFPTMRYDEFQPNQTKGTVISDAYNCGTNVILEREITVPEGDYFLEIDGCGSKLDGVGVIFTIRLDGKTVGSTELDTEFNKKYVFIHTNGQKQHLELAFMNDDWNPSTREDRNMNFRSARIFPVKTVAQDVFSTLRPMVSARISKNVTVDEVKWYAPECTTLLASLYITQILQNLYFDAPFLMNGFFLNGSDFDQVRTTNSNLQKNEPNVLFIGTNGTVSKKLNFAQKGRFRFVLRASGTACEDVYPHINLRLDGQKIGEFQLMGTDRTNYVLEPDVEIPVGEHVLMLQFGNDLYVPSTDPNIPNQDRNLQIESLRLLPQTQI